MTTTLRPAEPLRHNADGTRSRRFQVCVNGRPVGGLRLSTHPEYGPGVARIEDLRIEEPDRRRGRGTVAALACEEVVRGWGCKRIEASVPGDAEAALRLATALGYVVRSRNMAKRVDVTPPLPSGNVARPLTEVEYGPWLAQDRDRFVRSLTGRGVPETEAYAKADGSYARFLPDGLATTDTLISVLEQEGNPVGTLWLSLRPQTAFVVDVEVHAEQRGRGHGRTLMLLAEAQAAEAGKDRIALHVFAGNIPAERLYASLGYETTQYHLHKTLT
ncbi:GNAT family N-acetyltransferase [Streptomyces colonosanans]|uniref:GNAT family N-acetyltransferase n=1 Tax=Streptomyces colonosanans TaxID=1428652 RepID=A0A1S2Q3D5_9ACTN|nr:GNAT family N-acetyltransferase [Streptomyces colonosanans]OIK00650.1 GNAT family N-acetyltransferase [Streptomyces colonosanans]